MADCYCEAGYYDNFSHNADVSCVLCTAGANCTTPALTLVSLPLKMGYYRTSKVSADLRRCPDASSSESGCVGGVGDGEGPCKAWLAGPYCSRCNVTDRSRYYDADRSACLLCDGNIAEPILIGVGVIIACVVAALLWHFKPPRTMPRLAKLRLWLTRMWGRLSLRPKCKQLVGFYQVRP